MTFEELKELIALVNKSNLTEFKYQEGETKIRIRTGKYAPKGGKQQIVQQAAAPMMPMMSAAPAAAPVSAPPPVSAPAEAAKPAAEAAGNYLEVKSPIVGTFYRSSGPDKPAFVKVGDSIDKGSVVCIIEAMKLFNQIESDVKGKIVKVMVEEASPVEFDQVLFLVDPKG
ncbi:MAG: hypothetical protein RL757_2203 [Bacteroidota bacterium]|jgi:acetyl-CoA carboxylase biotin carboxyl carrier protein